MKEIFIKDLQKGQELQGETFVVKNLQKKTTKNNQEYWDLLLTDKSGVINAKVWADAIQYCDDVKNGDVVKINASVESNLNDTGLQLFIQSMQKIEDYDKTDFIKSSKVDLDSLFKNIEFYIKKIENPYLYELLRLFFSKKENLEAFKLAPAAEKAHHDFIGGLMQHVWEMLKLADSILEDYPEANKDLVFTGIIFHDIGKIYELEVNTNIERTFSGALLGHIYQGSELVNDLMKEIKNFPEKLKIHLTHIILSHHGALEWGSPVRPQTIEAHIVFLADKMSSQLQIVKKAIESNLTNDNTWTAYNNMLLTRIYLDSVKEKDYWNFALSEEKKEENQKENDKNALNSNNLELPF